MPKNNIKDYKELIKINERDLNHEFMVQAALFAKYSKLYRKAEYKAKDIKYQMSLTYSNLFLKYKSMDLNQKISDKVADMKVTIDKEYQQYMKIYLKAEHRANFLKDLAEAFKQKAQMLISLGADKRADKQMVMTIRGSKKDDNF